MKDKLIKALSAPGKCMADKLTAIGENPANYPQDVLNDLDWLHNLPEELTSYIYKLSRGDIL